MIAGPQEVRDEVGVRLEVDPLDRRVRREPGALDDEELEALGERPLRAPGRTPAEDAPVNEDDALHPSDPTAVHRIALRTRKAAAIE